MDTPAPPVPVEAVAHSEDASPDPDPASAPTDFHAPAVDPRRGALWTGAAPVEAGTARIAVATGGGWFATWKGLQVAGGGIELDGTWAISDRVAVTAAGGVATGTLNRYDDVLAPAQGWGVLAGARWMVVDGPKLRLAPFLAVAAAGGEGAEPPTPDRYGALVQVEGPTSLAGGGVALEVPFYAITFDLAVPVGGAVLTGQLPDLVPLTPGAFAPLFLLSEAGFTWHLGEHTDFRLGYVALATSWSWRWHDGPWTIDVSGHTNFLTGHLSLRAGRVF